MKGFTLVELVVVISVMAILAAVAAPRFANVDIFETRGNAGLLSSSLRYAQKTAIAQRRVVYVLYKATAPKSIDLCFSANCSQRVVNPENGNGYSLVFSPMVDVSAASFAFDSLGRPIPGNNNTVFTLTNKRNSNQTVTINIEADTGYIR